MPTYQYRCPTCSHEFEEFQSMSSEAITVCPACKGKTERIISGGAGLIFKGSGFYITDYRSSKYKADAAKDSSAGSSSEKSGKKDSSKSKSSESKSSGSSKDKS